MSEQTLQRPPSLRLSEKEQDAVNALQAVLETASADGSGKETEGTEGTKGLEARLQEVARLAREALAGLIDRPGRVEVKPRRLKLRVGVLEVQSGILAQTAKVTFGGAAPPFRIKGLSLEARTGKTWSVIADVLPVPVEQ